MLIVVTSDSHGRVDILKKIVDREPSADLYLDAGDSERQESELLPFLSVKGNRDHFLTNRYRIATLGNYRIFVFHGDRQQLSKEYLKNLAINNNCQIIIHGHTHVPFHVEVDGIHILCPGSVTYPRSLKGATYALIRLEDKIEVELVKVKA
jgi:hypothetical protein